MLQKIGHCHLSGHDKSGRPSKKTHPIKSPSDKFQDTRYTKYRKNRCGVADIVGGAEYTEQNLSAAQS